MKAYVKKSGKSGDEPLDIDVEMSIMLGSFAERVYLEEVMEVRVEFVTLDSGARLPEYAREGDAGMDFFLPEGKSVAVRPGEPTLVKLGVACAVPEGYELQLRAKSGLALKGLWLVNGVGTIDSGYRGELAAIVGNCGAVPYLFQGGDKVCQGVLARVERAECVEVELLGESERGCGGFGSTGRTA